MLQEEPNPYAPPQAPAELASSLAVSRGLAWCTLLLPFAVLPIMMMIPTWLPSGPWWGLIGFVLFLPFVAMGLSASIGLACAEIFQLFPERYRFLLLGFYVVTLIYEYATLFDMIYPNFSWK